MSLTGYKSYNNSNLQGNNTTDQQITNIESDLDVVEEKLALIKSVKDYGAVGDGITNDTTAIQSALNTTGRIWFPEGTYIVDGLTVLPNTHIYGDGRNKTIMKLSATGANLFNCHCENISIKSMSIDGSRDLGGLGHGVRGNISTSGIFDAIFEDLHIYNTNAYGIGLQTGTIKKIIINNCFIENTGSDGIDMKNKDGSNGNEAVIISNVIVKDPCMLSGNSNKTGLDLRGPCLLNNIAVLIENTPTSASCDGIRFRIGDDLDTNGRGGHRSSLTNFYVKAYSGYKVGLGISVGNDNINISNGTILNFARGIRTVAGYSQNKITNVSAIGCFHGFEDMSSDNTFINCSAQNSTQRGFYTNGCTRSTLIGCKAHNNGTHGFYDGTSTLTSLIKCISKDNTSANYNAFTGAEKISCLNGTTYLTNEINSSLTSTGTITALSFVGSGSGITNLNATQIASGIVDNTEFNYLDGTTSNIQTQLDSKVSLSTAQSITGIKTFDGLLTTFNGTIVANNGINASSNINVYDGNNIIMNDTGNIQISGTGSFIGDGSGLTNVMKLSGNQTVNGIKTFTDLIYANYGINIDGYLMLDDDLQINGVGNFIIDGTGSLDVRNGWMYGRSDGTSFYDPKTAFTLTKSPIGSIIEWNSPETAVVDNTTTIITTSIPTLDRGVWLCCGSATITKGTGTYITDNALFLSYDTAVNGTAYNLNQGNRYHIHTGSNTQNALFPTITLNATSNGAYIRPRYNIDVNTVGTMTISFKFVFTKIA